MLIFTPRTIAVSFTVTTFISASLLFFVQPMYAKMVLPHLGGSSAVWTTAMLFFQTCLIVGYGYAHLLSRISNIRTQMLIHLFFWGAGLVFLPIALPIGFSFSVESSAQWQTLVLFAVGVGVPFTALSANAPLIQSWYARSEGTLSNDPYFLYATSNAGSLLALLAFPLVAQPLMGATQISNIWALFYVVLGFGLILCGLLARSRNTINQKTTAENIERLTIGQVGLWIGLAFVPSSLMLSTTSFITTDIGSFPLIWVIPLALYLLTFVISFESRIRLSVKFLSMMSFASLVVYSIIIVLRGQIALGWISFGLLITAFFIVSLFAHKRLYDVRPGVGKLTTFYMCMSIGGALGGLFNSILAPFLFNDVYELAITVSLAALLVRGNWRIIRDLIGGLVIPEFVIFLLLFVYIIGVEKVDMQMLKYVIAIVTILFVLTMWRQPLRFSLSLAFIFVFSQLFYDRSTIYAERSFFGVVKVTENEETGLRSLKHGTTVHGTQLINGVDGNPNPISYYYSEGPMAQIVTSEFFSKNANIGVVGLGVGALACYRKPGQSWSFYEIDSAIDRIARDPELFTYMSSCASDTTTYIGDARLVLASQMNNEKFDILVIDAYSSDAIPIHLITKEAFELYLNRLAENGVLVLHISNRFFEIAPVIGATSNKLNLHSYINLHIPKIQKEGVFGSKVIALSRFDIANSLSNEWKPLAANDRKIWTDDYSNLLGALR